MLGEPESLGFGHESNYPSMGRRRVVSVNV